MLLSPLRRLLPNVDDSDDEEMPLPMHGASTVLLGGPQGAERALLASAMPAAVYGRGWTRAYATADDGFSLGSLYRGVADYDGPVLLLLEDMEGVAFGAYLTDAPRVSDRFFGTGDSFVFSLRPFRKFVWSGSNDYFCRAELHDLSVGMSDGDSALWIDADLNHGRSQPCETFDNKQLAGDKEGYFIIKKLECWVFFLN